MARKKRTTRRYSLEYLLAKQPKTLRKHPYFKVMMDYYRLSSRLQELRISRRCYSLLNRATVDPQNLKYFYRTYRLPRDPFFPLFFLIKRDYQRKQHQRREERETYIAAKVRSLPEGVLHYVKFLAAYEQQLHRRNQYPVWTSTLFPKTKKRADEYTNYSILEWIVLFTEYFRRIEERYPAHTALLSDRLLACFILECLPEQTPPFLPPLSRVNSNYRRLSKIYHPDRGGNPEFFLQLEWAREVLRSS